MKTFCLLVIIFFTICKPANCQELLKGDYYRYDTLETIKKVPYDSIRFDLHYVEIGTDSIWYAIIAMYSNRPNYYSFLSYDNRYSYTGINKLGSDFYSNLIFSDDYLGKFSETTKIFEKKQVKIYVVNDTTLIVDNEILKPDKGLKVFQSFTGY